VAVNTAIILEK